MSFPNYAEENIRSLSWQEHLRLRPGMYIGKLGDGSAPDDGIYILLKEVIDNSIDEFMMGYGKRIELTVTTQTVHIRDFGRGIPLGKVVDCVAKMNTGGKYDSQAFQKSIGLNGVGIKAVSALSVELTIQSFRDGSTKSASFAAGKLQKESEVMATQEMNGTAVFFEPDPAVFGPFAFVEQWVVDRIADYTYLNQGLTIILNGKKYTSRHGLLDFLQAKGAGEGVAYPVIHVKGTDIDLAFTHHEQRSSEVYYTFVNGQATTQGGTHLSAFKEAIVKAVRAFYKKNLEASDVRAGCMVALSMRMDAPIFESQTKTKLGAQSMGPSRPSVRSFIGEFVQSALNDFLHQNAVSYTHLTLPTIA